MPQQASAWVPRAMRDAPRPTQRHGRCRDKDRRRGRACNARGFAQLCMHSGRVGRSRYAGRVGPAGRRLSVLLRCKLLGIPSTAQRSLDSGISDSRHTACKTRPLDYTSTKLPGLRARLCSRCVAQALATVRYTSPSAEMYARSIPPKACIGHIGHQVHRRCPAGVPV